MQSTVIYITIYILLFCMSAMLYYIISKKSDTYDKIIAFSNFSTQVVLFIVAMSVVTNSFFLIDMALLYAGTSYILTVALMRLMLSNKL